MFAGPNGSGKSTLNTLVRRDLLGVYVNPDVIEYYVRRRLGNVLDLRHFGVETTADEVLGHFRASRLLADAGLQDAAAALRFDDGRLDFRAAPMNAYLASVTADFVRRKLLDRGATFSFETVMSSPDKVALLAEARARGYRTYLYYVATEAPAINVSRVRHRVRTGGHPVPEDKIVSRYHRSLALVADAARYASRAYFFDNSGTERVWLAEATDGGNLRMRVDPMPDWFKRAVWDELAGRTPQQP